MEDKTILDYSNELQEQIDWLDRLISETQKATNAIKINDDRAVRISKRKNGYQYYFEKPDGKLEYVKEKDIDKVKRIVQRDYYQVLSDKLLTIRYRIERFLKIYDIDMIKKVYENLSDARKALVVPMVTSDEEYIKTWRESHPGGLNPFPEEGKYLTIRGEKVRSKSEKILADYFEKLGIPYSYEPQVKLKDGRTFYPDFVLLNVRTRRTIYWEHFGLISDLEYAKNAFIKLGLFEKAGLEIGKDILFSMEDARQPLNLKQIENKIRANIL